MLCRSSENLKKNILILLVFSTLLFQGCKTLKPHGRPDAGHAVPDDYGFLFYYARNAGKVRALDQAFNEAASAYAIPAVFIRRTQTVRAVADRNGIDYLVFEGRYPGAFIREKIREREEFSEKWYRGARYYYNNKTGAVLISPFRNCLIAVFPGEEGDISPHSAAGGIIDLLLREEAGKGHEAGPETNLYISIREKPGDFLFLVPERFAGRDNLKEITFTADRISSTKLSVNALFDFSSEADARLFSPVFRLFIADLFRREGIGSFQQLAGRDSIRVSGNMLELRNIELEEDKADILIEKFFRYAGVVK